MAEEPKKMGPVRSKISTIALRFEQEPKEMLKILKLPPDSNLEMLFDNALAEQMFREHFALKDVGLSTETAVERTRREKTAQDEADLAWLAEVVALDRAIRRGEHGDPFRPHFERRGDMMEYPDPFADLLGCPGWKHRITFEQYQRCVADNRHLTWRSHKLLQTVERKLAGLWLAPQTCLACHAPMSGKLGFIFVKRVLREEIKLPGVRGKGAALRGSYPVRHPWCQTIVESLIDLEVELQGMAGDDPASVARRTAAYVEILTAVMTDFGPQGLTTAELRSVLFTIVGRSANAA